MDRFAQEIRLARARLVIARRGGLPVGYAFGYPLPPETGWWKAMDEETSAEFAAETGERTLGIVELAVRAGCRRQGVAARMHSHLRHGLGVARVTLAMRPDPEAAPAHAAYAAWGYHQVGHWQPADDEPVSHIMLLTLPVAAHRVGR
ncbi:GNAT family N-acetyltransferase [Streptomyces sp. IB2014 016-6]|uniref:GNAT family N-acetyltransferase n=1 Tax=Streptomyces sp. IB2014 016-6 TaxID=2517818 RepID=UPI001F50094A|nr:GNAT family N-acetyltransferase [Streptomyces sp. IB2014 016-6]